MEGIESESLRCLVQDCLAKHMYTSATFYADLLVSRTAYEPGDVYLLAQVRRTLCGCIQVVWLASHLSSIIIELLPLHAAAMPCRPIS